VEAFQYFPDGQEKAQSGDNQAGIGVVALNIAQRNKDNIS
jgi:hypothetical protein